MWKQLGKHKHRYSLILFGIGLAFLIAGFPSGGSAADQLRHVAAFAAVTTVAAFYYVSGVPGLLESIALLALAGLCLAIALLPTWLPLERFALTTDFTYASGAILFVLLVLLLRLPRRVRAWGRRLVLPETPAARRHECQLETAREDMARSEGPEDPVDPATACLLPGQKPAIPAESGIPIPVPETPAPAAPCRSAATPYRAVGQYKQALLDSFRAWSLANALPAMRWIRAVLSLVLALGGVTCIAIAIAMQHPAGAFLRSQRFALLFAGVAMLFYAAGVIGLGLLRGLALPGFAILTFYSVLGIIRIEAALAQRPLLLRAAVIVLFLALYGLLIHSLIRAFRQRHDLFNWIYELGPRIIGVDIALKDLLPIAEYTERIESVLTLDASGDEARIRQRALDAAAWYQHHLAVHKILPVGFVLEPDSGRLTLIAYDRPGHAGEHVGFCERILSLQGLTADVRHMPDPDWQTYRERLFPDAVTLHEIINAQQLELLEREGVDLHAIHPVRIELHFPDCDQRAAAQARLSAAGYEAVSDDSFDSREQEKSESMPDYCLAFIELNTRLGLERINTITGTVICLIEPYAGDLFGWELISPDDAEPFGES